MPPGSNQRLRLVLTLASAAECRPQPRDWTRDAIRLTGESDYVRGVAMQNLRRIPQLPKILLHELQGPRKALALDAIAARLVMIESLGRMGAELTPESLALLFSQSSFEVKAAALRYVKRRLQLIHSDARSESRYAALVFNALDSRPYQIRLQALFLIRELKLRGHGLAISYLCVTGHHSEVREYCRQTAREAR